MLSLVHLIYMAGNKCMHQNACYQYYRVSDNDFVYLQSLNITKSYVNL